MKKKSMFIISDRSNIKILFIWLEKFGADHIKLLFSFICTIYFVFDQSVIWYFGEIFQVKMILTDYFIVTNIL